MIRLGVCRIDQFPEGRPGIADWLRWGHLDYRLLRTSVPPSAREIEVFEGVMFRLQLSSGIYRTTSPDRFADLDAWLTPILAHHFPADAKIQVLDWAASDCSTSAAWHAALSAAFPHASLTASDLNVYMMEMQVEGEEGSYILDSSQGLLQYVRPPFVIRMLPPEPLWLTVNWWLARQAKARFERIWRELGIQETLVFDGENREKRIKNAVFRGIPLIHPTAVALARRSDSFRVERHSVFDPAGSPAHVIRTMNILNVTYFDAATLQRGARNVWQSLEPGGLWIVGRTIREHPVLHHASVFEKTGEGFRVVDRYNQKSEAEDAALAVRM